MRVEPPMSLPLAPWTAFVGGPSGSSSDCKCRLCMLEGLLKAEQLRVQPPRILSLEHWTASIGGPHDGSSDCKFRLCIYNVHCLATSSFVLREGKILYELVMRWFDIRRRANFLTHPLALFGCVGPYSLKFDIQGSLPCNKFSCTVCGRSPAPVGNEFGRH